MLKKSITKEELRNLPLTSFEQEIIVIENRVQFEHYLPELYLENVLGFDTETRPSFKKGIKNKVSLLQLATQEKAYLFRLNKIGLPNELAKFMASPDHLKIGAAIRDDLKALKKLSPFEPAGFIELQDYVKNFGIENESVQKIAGIVLNIRISKSARLSNWEAAKLTQKQKKYAATDAWVCLESYNVLSNI